VIGLMDAAGRDRAFLVGHDWGAAVAWWVAQTHPERVAKMVVINVPHPAVMLAHLRGSLAQLLKSWYIFFFQLPWLPEWLLSRRNWRGLTRALTTGTRPGAFAEADLDAYREAWSRPQGDALDAALVPGDRAATAPHACRGTRITVPTLMLWGVNDLALSRELAQPSIDLCDDGRLVFFEEASHWVHHEEPDRVNALIGAFLAAEALAAGRLITAFGRRPTSPRSRARP
jgi:epoxide hydrolase 4